MLHLILNINHKKLNSTWNMASMILHWFVFLSFVIIRPQYGEAGIVSGPVDHIVKEGELAKFNCFARGSSVHVFVNSSDPFPREEYEARGINITNHDAIQMDEYNITIVVEARPTNNNTRISCSVQGETIQDNRPNFQEGTLFIAGPPLAPDVNLVQKYLVNGFVLSNLSWTAPFTWSDFPIVNYSLTAYNHLNGDTTTIVKTANFTVYTYQFVSHGHECYDIDFKVIATNSLGGSQPYRVQAGHPIVPGEIGDITTEVTISSDESPNLMLSFLVPVICSGSYQRGSYNITIYDEADSVINKIGPDEYTQLNESSQQLITRNFSNVLKKNGFYYIEVTTESIGVVRTKRKKIDTLIQRVYSDHEPVDSKMVVGSSVGSIAGLLIITVIILTTILCIRRSKRNNTGLRSTTTGGRAIAHIKPSNKAKKKPLTLKIERSNPIYEGPLYESTPGESVKSLLSSCSTSTPNTPVNDISPRYHGMDFPPSLPPPRNVTVSVSQQPKLELSVDIDTIKASFGTVEADQVGAEYMTLKNVQADGQESDAGSPKNQAHAAEDAEYATLK